MTKINTPFSEAEIKPDRKEGGNRLLLPLIGAGAVILILGIIFLINGFATDRYRTLEPLDVEELTANHERFLGSHFKLIASVDSELGTELGHGKLVAFRDSETRKIVPVMITSDELSNRLLSKGQRYKIEVEVARGGLLHAIEFEKD